MKIHEYQSDCQLPDLKNLADGPQESAKRSLRHSIRSYLGPRSVRILERRINDLMNWYASFRDRGYKPPSSSFQNATIGLMAGDLVRIRSLEEIENTLDH